MVIDKLDVPGMPIAPVETQPPLAINPDAPLPGAVAAQFFQAVGRRQAQILQGPNGLQQFQTRQGRSLNLARMRAAEEYGKGVQVAVQMYYAALSLELYDSDPTGLDAGRCARELRERLLPFPHEEGTQFEASFGHLNGYSAIYYTYMWSLVIAKDLFSHFEGDLMNRAVADRYRRSVLAAGGTKDARELARDFLGREYSTTPFEAWLNRG